MVLKVHLKNKIKVGQNKTYLTSGECKAETILRKKVQVNLKGKLFFKKENLPL